MEKQLKMLRYSKPVVLKKLPEGYSYERFRGTEAEISDWLTICSQGVLGNNTREQWETNIANYPDLKPEEDVYFVLDATGKRVASITCVVHNQNEGYIHMVASLPECRGKGIGHASLSFALEILESRGCSFVDLTTDDYRLAAIKTYLDAGFQPVLYADPESDMRTRWEKVFEALTYPPVAFIEE